MSLFSAVQSAASALSVSQLGLQVVGNNIANANTPGYIRQQLVQAPAIGYRQGDVIIGQGVRPVGVQQVVNELVLERLRSSNSDLGYQEQLEAENVQVESWLNELTDRDFSSMLNRFAGSFQEIANQPGSEAIRVLALQRGQEISNQLQSLTQSVQASATRSKQDLFASTDDLNRLTRTVAQLNQRIVEIEGGSLLNSDAVGLRDERIKALGELSTLVNITSREQTDGSVSVFIGGDYVVAGSITRQFKAQVLANDPRGIEIQFQDTGSAVPITGGRIKGLYETATPNRPGGIQNKLDSLAQDIIRVVNRIHSQGQGTAGLRKVTGEVNLINRGLPFEQGNSSLDIDSGSFTITVTDARTSTTQTVEIPVSQIGLSTDTTPDQIASQINAISGLSASWSSDGRLQIASDSEAIRFSFSNDTSGVLSAMGINTFFRGNSAGDIAVRPTLFSDPSQIATSLGGVGNGTGNALALSDAITSGSSLLDGRSLSDVYQRMVSDTNRTINEQKGIADGLRNFAQTLESQHLSVSGVNLDEEAVKMISYQRAFQATSKVISTAAEMIQTLIDMV